MISKQISQIKVNNILVSNVFILKSSCKTQGKGHYYENQNVEKQPKKTSKISVFLVHHYYENQNVEKNEKNIESLIFVWFSHFNYLWRMGFVNSWR